MTLVLRDPAIRRLLRFIVFVMVPVGIAVFLLLSRFTTSWDGVAVSSRPISPEDPPAHEVLVQAPETEPSVHRMPIDAVEGLGIAHDPLLLPEVGDLPNGPRTYKEPFTLHFAMERDGVERTYATTTPQALGLGLLTAFLVFFVRNMIVGGSPLAVRPRPTVLPAPLPKAGMPAGPAPRPAAPAKRRGPPPKGGKRKRRRR